MKTVWKKNLADTARGDADNAVLVYLPAGSKPLTCQMQSGHMCLWFLTDSEAKRMDLWRFYVVGTGHEMPSEKVAWFATVQSGPFVWHVFYAVEEWQGQWK